MNTFRADLHCHSTASDGTLTPEEIVSLAKKIGLNALSITDHDTIEAYFTAIETARQVDLQLITGIELSSVLQGVSIHILGYCFPFPNPVLETFCSQHQERRKKRCREMLMLLSQHGMPIEEEELLQSLAHKKTTIGRPHIAQMMIKKGFVESLNEAFKKYLGDGCPCYVQGERFSPQETISTIHQAGGVAIIAHPHLIKEVGILKQLLEMNFDGMECYYSKFLPKEQKRWLKIAEKRSWLVTGGSDFHGSIKPNIPLGCSWINEEYFNQLVERKGIATC